MSDNESTYDDDEVLNFDDFSYNEAEDLATHTMPSPPFLDYDSDSDKFSNSSKWEYDHDDYWDQDAPRQRKPENTRAYTNGNNEKPNKRRRRVDGKNDVPRPRVESYNTPAPTVIWKSKQDLISFPEEPIVSTGQGEKVSLLKDWKERFKYQPNLAASQPESTRTNKRGSQIATAVLIRNNSPEPFNNTTLPPTRMNKAAGIPSRSRLFPSIPSQNGPVSNSTIPHPPSTSPSPISENPSKLIRPTTTASQKRPVSELLNHSQTDPPAPQKRLRTSTKNSLKTPQPLANKTNISIPPSRKRKADDEDSTSPRKRTNTSTTKGAEGNGSPIKRSTRRRR